MLSTVAAFDSVLAAEKVCCAVWITEGPSASMLLHRLYFRGLVIGFDVPIWRNAKPINPSTTKTAPRYTHSETYSGNQVALQHRKLASMRRWVEKVGRLSNDWKVHVFKKTIRSVGGHVP